MIVKQKSSKLEGLRTKPWEFLAVFLLIFFVISILLFAIDFVPESPEQTAGTVGIAEAATVTFMTSDLIPADAMAEAPETPAATPPSTVRASVPARSLSQASAPAPLQNTAPVTDLPVRIAIPKVGINTPVGNPTAITSAALDTALLKGAVRYPGSGSLSDGQRMFIFGHQSYLPVVRNKAFQAFNGLQNVRAGDEIIVYSSSALNRYRVVSIEYVDASASGVELGGNDRMLYLVTCDSFGNKKSKRYKVAAEFVSQEALPISQ